ncbi:MAG TPA: hypothetical protein PLJ27_23820 [Polyangiaceae bacterium]|jgi:hypothetical protein|nr:MAG: hypothetical protein BWY17_00590 [Deltaproteobacteria bacterium ADurb.Bin207]HNT00021.1 hypothetical protein [Polyangiaceae bacterium]HNZ23380.1 hypothetical protein [Polyangiaceae bacterium]HOD22810.1 hypothetical protein [Polyangiaceae bacterium]HOE50202.1 hypothetical protein [Polyangiaceae bacterium]
MGSVGPDVVDAAGEDACGEVVVSGERAFREVGELAPERAGAEQQASSIDTIHKHHNAMASAYPQRGASAK